MPDTIKQGTANTVKQQYIAKSDNLATRIAIQRYPNYKKLLKVTARILAMYKRKPKVTFKNVAAPLIYDDIFNAKEFWIVEAQIETENDIKKGGYKRLCPRKREDGIYIVGHRVQNWIEVSYNKRRIILLPYSHHFSRLYTEYVHGMGHLGVSATASKVRAKYWIVKLHKLVKSIKSQCTTCIKIEKKTSEQIMGQLPEERLKPAPP